MFQKSEFMAELIRHNLTVEQVANIIGVNSATLYRKIKGDSDFLRWEINELRKALEMSGADVLRIFFA